MTEESPLDRFISPQIRATIEERYYAKVTQQSLLKEALKDPLFLKKPSAHVALFSDHGVVHVRDVAQQILQVLSSTSGMLIPIREAVRFNWMKAYGVVVAYVHDIGMVDLSTFGRSMHPEYSTQAVLGAAFDSMIEALVAEDRGGIATRLSRLFEDGVLAQTPTMVLREMIAMAICHSKSKVPVDLLNNRPRLRRLILDAATTDLNYLYHLQRFEKAERERNQLDKNGPGKGEVADADARVRAAKSELGLAAQKTRVSAIAENELRRDYEIFEKEAFAWLVSDDPQVKDLVCDVIDTLRTLRCADALRQRGTVLKTSGNYEVFVDQRSANAIYALRLDDEHLYLLEVPDRIGAGEANLASSELDKDGNLRISFYHGQFADHETVLYAAGSSALVVNDIQTDVIQSFLRPERNGENGLRQHSEIQILIEAVDDNPAFADLVCLALLRLNPVAAAQTRVVHSLQANSATERAHYLNGTAIDWNREQRLKLLKKISNFGHLTDGIDLDKGFKEVRQIQLVAGDTLIEAGGAAGFVYIPEEDGLRILPLGGYEGFPIRPWIPVGVTGVIRGALRNADVVADTALSVLAIPKDIYLKHWHRTYDQVGFAKLFVD